MKFRSTLAADTTGVGTEIFNALSIYVPKSLAKANLAENSYDETAVTPDKYAVLTVTVDNYKDVLADGSVLLSQWLPIFNDGSNLSVILYIVVFDDTDFEPTVTSGAVTWAPLTKAFNDLYFISFFKTMFSEYYTGAKVTVDEDGEETVVSDDSNYIDMALALSYQCETEGTMSFDLIEIKVDIPEEGEEDTNPCKVLTLTHGDETLHCTTLAGSSKEDRAEYFWGYLNLIGGSHSNLIVHNGAFMTPIVLAKWFTEPNGSGLYVGNKLAKIRLNDSKVKPTGLPSPLNSDVNLNLRKELYEHLDDKNIGYFISIADGSDNDAELLRDRSIANYPITAYMIAKWIDYNASQDMARYLTDSSTLANPVLANEETYSYIQTLLLSKIQKFTPTNRIVNIQTSFPSFSEAKQGNKFVGTAVWKATYIDDLDGVEVTGSISF